jgi:hypothetical protein
MALLLGRRFQTEEERAGPSDTRDLSRYLRERAESFTVEVKAIVQHAHTMSDPVPFSNQCSASTIFADRRQLFLPVAARLMFDRVLLCLTPS